MNNEPVAWMREDGVIAFHKQKEVDSQGYKWQPLYTHPLNNNEPVGKVVQYDKNGSLEHAWFGEPPPVGTLLYTHPVKELTDEEIIDCVNKEFDLELKDGNATVLAFARAILRKASKK